MDYDKLYNNLIITAKNRPLDSGYYEEHHIIPKCMGGSNDTDNLVLLSAREHFIAHQILIKIYPGNQSLIKAANMMCCFSTSQVNRSYNKRYEWLRIKMSQAMKISGQGANNSQFGTVWVYNEADQTNKKVDKISINSYIEEGWKKGRKLKWNTKYSQCKVCNTSFAPKTKELFCSDTCKQTTIKGALDGREQEFLDLYNEYKSMNKALKKMGFQGAMGGWYIQAKQILNKAT